MTPSPENEARRERQKADCTWKRIRVGGRTDLRSKEGADLTALARRKLMTLIWNGAGSVL